MLIFFLQVIDNTISQLVPSIMRSKGGSTTSLEPLAIVSLLSSSISINDAWPFTFERITFGHRSLQGAPIACSCTNGDRSVH